MSMLNEVVLQGRLTAAPELKKTNSGNSVTSFSLAVESRRKDDDGNYIADFVNIVAWKNTAEFICNYFRKGSMILIRGNIATRKYTDRDGHNRTAVEVNAESAFFCGRDKEDNAQPAKAEDFAEFGSDDDLPF